MNGENFKWLTWGGRAIKSRGQHGHREAQGRNVDVFEETEISSIRTHVGM